jgi:uncharacterized damage-inducible protein DinB
MSAESLATLYGLNHQVLKINLDGITHKDSLVQPKPFGNCINWIMGHIVWERGAILKLAGEKPLWDEAEVALYKRGSRPLTDGEKALRLERIVADLDRSQELLIPALARMTPDQLAQGDANGTVEDKLAFLQFHESYHAGQIGLLRRLVGKEGKIQ